MTRKINGILFDLGDTLLDFGRVDIGSLFEAGARLAYDYLQSLGHDLPSFARYHRRQLWAIRWNYFKSRFTRREFNTLDVLGKLGRRMGHDLSPGEMLELAWLWYKPLSECANIEPGLKELLVEFRDRGLKMGLVSNTFVPGAVLDRHLKKTELDHLLPVRIYSCDVKFRKPHPQIFEVALDQAGLQPQHTLFVGDSPDADIRGANRIGMVSVLKDPAGKHAGEHVPVRHRIRSILELRAVLDNYELPEN